MALKLTTYRKGSSIPELEGENLFHSTELFAIYEKIPGYSPLLITATNEGKLVAKLLAVIRNIRIFIPPFSIKQCNIYGLGEYFIAPDQQEFIFGEMLQHLTREILRDSFMIEFRNIENSLFGYKYFRQNSYFPVNWFRVRNSLHSQQSADARISPSRMRQIRNAYKNGATIEEVTTVTQIKDLSKMLHQVDNSFLHEHFPNTKFFEQIQEHLYAEKKAKMFIVKYKERIIGASLCLYSENNAFIRFSGGMRKRYAKQYPGILAVWAALKDAYSAGYNHIEFMDMGFSFMYHGYRNFALRFGGKQYSTRRWFCFRWKWLNKLCTKLYV